MQLRRRTLFDPQPRCPVRQRILVAKDLLGDATQADDAQTRYQAPQISLKPQKPHDSLN
jgi:hypothetical protein